METNLRIQHKTLHKIPFVFYMIAPVIYLMIFPAVMMDVFISFYQMVCFPVFGISKVLRKDYILLDRHRLKYLKGIEKLNCDYCGYFNGVIAYSREIASLTEQYFCPIRHALHTKGQPPRNSSFLPYGETEDSRKKMIELRDEVRHQT